MARGSFVSGITSRSIIVVTGAYMWKGKKSFPRRLSFMNIFTFCTVGFIQITLFPTRIPILRADLIIWHETTLAPPAPLYPNPFVIIFCIARARPILVHFFHLAHGVYKSNGNDGRTVASKAEEAKRRDLFFFYVLFVPTVSESRGVNEPMSQRY